METEGASTRHLLEQWHQGEDAALAELLQRHLPFVRRQVSRRLGPLLRRKGETQDFVQEAVIELLRYGPRFLLKDENTFRRLLARIIENVLCDQYDWFTARRRELHRERPLPHDTVLYLDAPVQQVRPAGEVAGQHEWEARVRLAVELLPPAERQLILWRQWDRRPYGDIARELGIAEDAARMRCNRALLRLQETLDQLLQGRIEGVLGGEGRGDESGSDG